MATLDEVLSGAAAPETNESAAQQPQSDPTPPANEPPTGDPETTQEPAAAEPAAVDPNADPDGATPAQEPKTMVPLKALEEERKGRQDWKEKAIRAEAERDMIQRQLEQARQPQAQEQPTQLTPELALLNERMNMSEIMVRQQHQDVDDMLTVFSKAAEQNPALRAQLLQERHPWQWMYDQAKRMRAMEEIGSDPEAYKQRLRDELMAQLQAEQTASVQAQAQAAPAAAPAPAPALPKSLATNRSAAPRTAPAWTGPSPLENLFVKR
ncbi:hypothetical protein [Ralstonia insidiosa]|uniref:hypothetical protein n=1 Tax=Ralstonia insidiosa TaxID=190721 RepID=UPI000CEE2B06|nr:hypothetical protein [Ralstonia insidiosa]